MDDVVLNRKCNDSSHDLWVIVLRLSNLDDFLLCFFSVSSLAWLCACL